MKECKFFQQLIVEDFYSEIDRMKNPNWKSI